jgi:hypothetical protein
MLGLGNAFVSVCLFQAAALFRLMFLAGTSDAALNSFWPSLSKA